MKEHKSKLVYFAGIMLLFAVLVAPCMQPKASAAEFELKFGALNPEGLYMAKIAKAWMAKIEKETNGRVHFTSYWGGTLITPPDAPDEVARGVVDVGLFSADYPKVLISSRAAEHSGMAFLQLRRQGSLWTFRRNIPR
jgi:TRAP-type C4-dicarboxylate transport system substrate-binding protein